MEEKQKEKIELIRKSFELKQLKRYKEAIELLYKALEYDDNEYDSVELLSQIGDLHISLKNYDRALEEFQRALSINNQHVYSLQKCYEIYIRTNRFNKALKIAQNLCEGHKSPESYYAYMYALIKLEKYQDAMDVFNSLDDSIKMDCDILYLISTIYPEKRVQFLEKILSLDSSNLNANLDMATIEFEKGNYSKVISYCLNIDKEDPLALYYLGYIELDRRNYGKAIELFVKAINLDTKNRDFYLDLAKAYSDICWYDEALLAIKKSINISLIKNDHDSLDEKYYLSGWILVKQNKFSRALLNLKAINKKSKYYEHAQILIQIINLKNTNLASAKKKLEQYYENDKTNPFLLDALALVYKELKMYRKAINIYSRALELYPSSIYYAQEKIDLLIDDKDYEDAMFLINQTKEKYENCANIYNSLARIYYRLNKLDDALDSLNRYVELDNNNAEVFYFRGLILNDLSRFEEAKDTIFIAIKLNPAVAKYYCQMARAYTGLEDYESAILYAKEAIEINPSEIKFKKQAYEISMHLGDNKQASILKNQLKRSEKISKI